MTLYGRGLRPVGFTEGPEMGEGSPPLRAPTESQETGAQGVGGARRQRGDSAEVPPSRGYPAASKLGEAWGLLERTIPAKLLVGAQQNVLQTSDLHTSQQMDSSCVKPLHLSYLLRSGTERIRLPFNFAGWFPVPITHFGKTAHGLLSGNNREAAQRKLRSRG